MDRELIDIVSKSYLMSKRKLVENDLGITTSDELYLDHYRNNVYHIDYVVSCLCEEDRFIIDNEVIKGKRGNWYYAYMSPPTYYRHRKRAYTNFLNSL